MTDPTTEPTPNTPDVEPSIAIPFSPVPLRILWPENQRLGVHPTAMPTWPTMLFDDDTGEQIMSAMGLAVYGGFHVGNSKEGIIHADVTYLVDENGEPFRGTQWKATLGSDGHPPMRTFRHIVTHMSNRPADEPAPATSNTETTS